MSPKETLLALLRGVHEDQARYVRLRGLLEDQFRLALQQRADELIGLAQAIEALVDELQLRRQERQHLLGALLGRQAELTLTALQQRLPTATGQTIGAAAQRLEQLVQECKRLNARNCELIVEQQALMQRLLGTEQDTYAEL